MERMWLLMECWEELPGCRAGGAVGIESGRISRFLQGIAVVAMGKFASLVMVMVWLRMSYAEGDKNGACNWVGIWEVAIGLNWDS